jgi:prepilin signal peptidase PulO-like enzyme (type II secretory pathway)
MAKVALSRGVSHFAGPGAVHVVLSCDTVLLVSALARAFETGEVSFAILGPYHSETDAADGLVREVGRRQGFMLIECAHCKRVLGAVHCLPQFSRLTSHGTCSSCNAELRARLGLEPEKEPTDA